MGDMFFKSGGRTLPKGPRISAWLETPACMSHISKVVPVNRPGISQGSEDSWLSAPPSRPPQGDYTLGMGIQYPA